jgi:hypothetical protein
MRGRFVTRKVTDTEGGSELPGPNIGDLGHPVADGTRGLQIPEPVGSFVSASRASSSWSTSARSRSFFGRLPSAKIAM